jgi:hypothetical protein
LGIKEYVYWNPKFNSIKNNTIKKNG